MVKAYPSIAYIIHNVLCDHIADVEVVIGCDHYQRQYSHHWLHHNKLQHATLTEPQQPGVSRPRSHEAQRERHRKRRVVLLHRIKECSVEQIRLDTRTTKASILAV